MKTTGAPSLSIVILTYQEEANISSCLESLKDLGAKVFVVDSGSTDRTLEIAREAGCEVIVHQWELNHARQLNWALENIEISSEWIMRLDADERLTEELVLELQSTLFALEADICGLMVKRRVYFWGQWIRFGGYYPTWLLRIWRRDGAYCENRWMDEHMILRSGCVRNLQNDIIDENKKGVGFWIDKHNRYADKEVCDILERKQGGGKVPLEGQVGRRRWLKNNIYARSPLLIRAIGYWLFRYIVLFGFLDGRAGLVFHFLQGCWYRMLVDVKLIEFERKAGKCEY